MSNYKLDNLLTVITPEGIEINQCLAGIWSRSYAWVIDLFIRVLMYILLLIITSYMELFGYGLMLIGVFILEWFYPVFFEIKYNGQTPGKMLLKIRAINADATYINWSESLLRNLLRIVDFLPFMYVTGLISILLSRNFQRIGDLAANTIVIYDSDNDLDQAIPHFKTQPLSVDLNLDEQHYILKYAERCMSLSEERQVELASYLSNVTHDKHPTSKEDLLAAANHILGR
ncbi:MAG: RDD family protein [Gammaproteobacteria bacterium]|nr:RDD family protein [Gammaproteobacteria bacterium]